MPVRQPKTNIRKPAKRFENINLYLCLAPACAARFALGTEPALALREIDPGLVVIVLRRHVIDALAAGEANIAFDVAA